MSQTSAPALGLEAPAQCCQNTPCNAHKPAEDEEKQPPSIAVMCLCTLVPEQRKSEFCSVLCYQYLILRVIATSVLSTWQWKHLPTYLLLGALWTRGEPQNCPFQMTKRSYWSSILRQCSQHSDHHWQPHHQIVFINWPLLKLAQIFDLLFSLGYHSESLIILRINS